MMIFDNMMMGLMNVFIVSDVIVNWIEIDYVLYLYIVSGFGIVNIKIDFMGMESKVDVGNGLLFEFVY